MKHDNKLINTYIALALPTVIEQFLSTLLQYVDTAMVGHLGAEATASISLSTTYNWFFGSIMGGIGMGFLSYIARAIGEKNEYNIRHALGMSLVTALSIGFILTAVTEAIAPFIPLWMGAEEAIRYTGTLYFRIINTTMVLRACLFILACVLRSTGDSGTPMKINLSVNFLNIGLNYLFIYMLSYGAIGAGIATAISYGVGGIVMMIAFVRNPYVCIKREYFKPEKRVLKDALAIGIPAMITRMISCMGHIVATSFVSAMGTVIFAAHSIAITAEQLVYIPGYGMQAATSTLIGNAVGEQNRDKERRVTGISLQLIICLMLAGGVLLFVFAGRLMSIFTKDAEVIRIGTSLLKIVAFTEPLYGAYIVMDGIYVGLGRTKIPMVIEFIGHWGIRILSAYILINYFGAGIREYWFCMIADNICKTILLALGLVIIGRRRNSRKGQIYEDIEK